MMNLMRLGSKGRRFFATNLSGDMSFMVRYHFVEDVHYKRIPFHKKHIELVESFEKKGVHVIGGSMFPNDGAILWFQCDSKDTVEDFIKKDPFVTEKLVKMWEIDEIELESKKNIDQLAKDYSYIAN
jgi:uncharacterized protein YciI